MEIKRVLTNTAEISCLRLGKHVHLVACTGTYRIKNTRLAMANANFRYAIIVLSVKKGIFCRLDMYAPGSLKASNVHDA